MEQAQPSQSQEDAAAELIASILIGQAVVPNPTLAIAQALLTLIPSFLPDPLAGRISADIAVMVVRDSPTLTSGSVARTKASGDNVAYRALYALAAVTRLVKAVSGPGEDGRLEKALKVEESYFEAHRNAAQRREKAADVIDAAAQRWGDTLGWHSVRDSRTDRECASLHGSNFSIDDPPGGFYPGWRDGGRCRCSPGAPF